MSIDENLFQKWKYASEGDNLDFKREQYQISKDNKTKQAELIKDILAMANSWSNDDAYIVIGIEETPDKPNNVCGINDHVDDAQLQEIVNKKLDNVCKFSYSTHTFEGKTIGVIKIPHQDGIFYLKKDFLHLKQDKVYVRHGSSNSIASPKEIFLMGRNSLLSEKLKEPQNVYNGLTFDELYLMLKNTFITNENQSVLDDFNSHWLDYANESVIKQDNDYNELLLALGLVVFNGKEYYQEGTLIPKLTIKLTEIGIRFLNELEKRTSAGELPEIK